MQLHESHDEGGFGVSNNTIIRHAASYTTNARFVAFLGTFACPSQQVWLPGNDLQDPTTWTAPPLLHGHALARGPPAELRLHRQAGRTPTPTAVRRWLEFKRSEIPSSAFSSSHDQ